MIILYLFFFCSIDNSFWDKFFKKVKILGFYNKNSQKE